MTQNVITPARVSARTQPDWADPAMRKPIVKTWRDTVSGTTLRAISDCETLARAPVNVQVDVRTRAQSCAALISCFDRNPSDFKFKAFEPEPGDTDDGERWMVIPR
jgi:hypothetical protein